MVVSRCNLDRGPVCMRDWQDHTCIKYVLARLTRKVCPKELNHATPWSVSLHDIGKFINVTQFRSLVSCFMFFIFPTKCRYCSQNLGELINFPTGKVHFCLVFRLTIRGDILKIKDGHSPPEGHDYLFITLKKPLIWLIQKIAPPQRAPKNFTRHRSSTTGVTWSEI